MWTALYMPTSSSGYNPTQDGFETKEAAWDYIRDNICPLCRKELELGYYEEEEDGIMERYEVDHPSRTDCGAEWLVVETEKLNQCETLRDIFTAAGFTKIEK